MLVNNKNKTGRWPLILLLSAVHTCMEYGTPRTRPQKNKNKNTHAPCETFFKATCLSRETRPTLEAARRKQIRQLSVVQTPVHTGVGMFQIIPDASQTSQLALADFMLQHALESIDPTQSVDGALLGTEHGVKYPIRYHLNIN